jgi:hypothetical protein
MPSAVKAQSLASSTAEIDSMFSRCDIAAGENLPDAMRQVTSYNEAKSQKVALITR